MLKLILLFIAMLFLSSACKKDELIIVEGCAEIEIDAGENWLHEFPLFLGIAKQNPPQFAIWVEDTSGNYLSTVYVTKKIATEGWISNKGNRRKEALPYWCHQRGIVYDDGLMLPTKENPLPDAVTGATPKTGKVFYTQLEDIKRPFILKAEFNHSTDFNDCFPKDAIAGEVNYSGGEEGSGQPAVIFADTIYPNIMNSELKLIGRSSADGSDGKIYTDLEKLTTAKSIVTTIYFREK